jgi:anti-sigma B factor antagonist
LLLGECLPHQHNQWRLWMELEIKNQSDQITHLVLRGRLDTAGVGEIELRFTSHTVPRAKPLLLDISDVTFVASLGLRMLLTIAKAWIAVGQKRFSLVRSRLCVRSSAFPDSIQLMPVHHDEGTALAFLAEGEGR